MRWKDTVNWCGVTEELMVGLNRMESIYLKNRLGEIFITSVLDGEHMEGSKHYTGEAADIQSRTLVEKFGAVHLESKINELTREINRALGPQWTLILEDFRGGNEHFHLEFDPPAPETR